MKRHPIAVMLALLSIPLVGVCVISLVVPVAEHIPFGGGKWVTIGARDCVLFIVTGTHKGRFHFAREIGRETVETKQASLLKAVRGGPLDVSGELRELDGDVLIETYAQSYRWLTFPLWAIVGLLALCPAFVVIRGWTRRRRRRISGQCPACGYDLTGNQSGTCPECGADA